MSERNLSPVLKWVAGVLAVVAVSVLLVPLVVVSLVGSSVREMAVSRLEERFDEVRLDALELHVAPGWSLMPRLGATGSGLSISLPERAGVPPFVEMKEFTVELSLHDLLRSPIRIDRLDVDRLEIRIPPGRDDDDRDESDGDRDSEDSPPAFVVETLEADGTVLLILRGDPKDEPLRYDLHELRIASAGLGEPMRFDAFLENAKPPGQIETTGRFGPLQLSDVGASPVSGDYTFARAKLGDFGGIAGTLYSEGRFTGELSRIEVEGFTRTPDFLLTSAGNPLPLETEFRATVDGTSGDTFLEPVDAVLGESSIHTRGGVFEVSGTDGKTVCLDAEGMDGRIEDFLYLAMDSEPALMTGDIRFRSLILIPSTDADVIEKLELDGEFLIDAARFTESEIQEKVDGLSDVGRGGRGADAVDALRDERVLSDMRGEFTLRDGVMTLSAISFAVPGASVTLEGTYGLLDQQIDFRGELRLDAKLSETTTGWKSILLKLADPLFGGEEAGAVIPIAVSGTPDDPSFGPDMGRIVTRERVTRPPEPSGVRREFRKTIATCEGRLGREVRGPPPSS